METSFKNWFYDMYFDSVSKIHDLYCTAKVEQVIFDKDDEDVQLLIRDLAELHQVVNKLSVEIFRQIVEVGKC